jgi:hypothetical protein
MFSVQVVANGALPYTEFLRNLAVGESSAAKPLDLAEYLRRNSSALPTSKVLTVGDWLKMVGANARRDAT